MHFCLHICKITLEGYVQKQTMHALWEGNWCEWVAKDGRETSLWLLLYPLTLNHLYWLLEKQNCIKIVNTWKYYWFTKKLDAQSAITLRHISVNLCVFPQFIQVSLIHLVEVTWVRIQVPLMVEMSSILDPTNRGPRKTEILLAAVAYLKMFREEKDWLYCAIQ